MHKDFFNFKNRKSFPYYLYPMIRCRSIFNKIVFFMASMYVIAVNAASGQKNGLVHALSTQDSAFMQGKIKWKEAKAAASTQKMNIVLIVADDLGKHDISVYGNPLIETPNIDAIAKNGAIFGEGYATAAICSPSRAGLLTGRYQQRFGYHLQPHQRYPANKLQWWWFKNLINTGDFEPAEYDKFPDKASIKAAGLPQSEISLAEFLKKFGYVTAWIGKWHLGYHAPLLPADFGFDYRYGCLEAYTLFAKVNDPEVVNARVNEFTDKVIWKGGRKGHCAIRENDILIDEQEYLTYAFARRATKFIRDHKNEPFFLYLPVTAPHTPYQAPKKIYDRLTHITNHRQRVYFAMIIALDEAVGQIMEELKSNQLLENTLIIFTSDNGAALYSKTVTNEPLAGGKMSLFEGGINVPLLMMMKGKIPAGVHIHQPVSLCDIFATIADGIKAQLPGDRIYDGVSLWPLLTQSTQENPHEALYWISDYNLAMRWNNLKIIIDTKHKTLDVFDLKSDKYEKKDISQSNPEWTKKLENMLMRFAAQMPPQKWPRIMEYSIRVNGKSYVWAI
jgi:arylsulfatase A-like enzyme